MVVVEVVVVVVVWLILLLIFHLPQDTDDSEDTFSDFSLKSEPVVFFSLSLPSLPPSHPHPPLQTNDEKNKKRLRSFTSSKTMSSSTSTPSPPPSRPSNRRAPSLSSTLGGNEGTSRKDGGEDGDWGQQTSSKELLAYMSSRKGGKYGTISRIKQGVFPIAFSSPTLRLQDFEKGVPSNYKSSLPSESLKTSDWDGLWTFLSGLYPDNSVEILNFLACFGQVYDKVFFFFFLFSFFSFSYSFFSPFFFRIYSSISFTPPITLFVLWVYILCHVGMTKTWAFIE